MVLITSTVTGCTPCRYIYACTGNAWVKVRELLHTTHGEGMCVGNILCTCSQYDLFYVNKSVENIFASLLECRSLPFYALGITTHFGMDNYLW